MSLRQPPVQTPGIPSAKRVNSLQVGGIPSALLKNVLHRCHSDPSADGEESRSVRNCEDFRAGFLSAFGMTNGRRRLRARFLVGRRGGLLRLTFTQVSQQAVERRERSSVHDLPHPSATEGAYLLGKIEIRRKCAVD